MTRTTNFSDEVYTWLITGQTDFFEVINENFDITFQTPKTLAKGTANFILALGIGGAVTTKKDIKATVTLKKNTTTIGSAVESRNVSRPNGTAADTPYSEMVNIPYPISARVHFKRGDILRVNISVEGKNDTGNGDFALGHDPAGRVDPRAAASARRIFRDDQSTKSTFAIPFVLLDI